MCTHVCLKFVSDHLTGPEVRGRSVLEVGAVNVNGSSRPLVTALGPASYLGVDMEAGPGVDEVCPAEQLIARYGGNAFDIVLSTDMMEHVFDWRAVLHNMKGVLKPGGLLVFTTVSIGFGYHAYPYDFWRFEREDMQQICADFQIAAIETDPATLAIGIKAVKPQPFVEADLSGVALHSMITRRRSVNVSGDEVARFHRRRRILQPLQNFERGVRRLRDKILRR